MSEKSLPDSGDRSQQSRRRIDLRTLPYGIGYVIAGIVCLLVILAARWFSEGRETPSWWWRVVVPILYWSSPFLVALAIFFRIRRRRARKRDSA